MKPKTAIFLSGAIWFIAGFALLFKGIRLLLSPVQGGEADGALAFLAPYAGNSEQAALAIIALALFVGLLKGRTVLKKAAEKTMARIASLPTPIRFTTLYTWRYYLLIALMMSLGAGLRWASIPPSLHGGIDIAIGSALIHGALAYLRALVGKAPPAAAG